MAPRSNWKGYLRLSLVSCPVSLYPATSKEERIKFHRVNKETMHRWKQLNVDFDTMQPVESLEFGKGLMRSQKTNTF